MKYAGYNNIEIVDQEYYNSGSHYNKCVIDSFEVEELHDHMVNDAQYINNGNGYEFVQNSYNKTFKLKRVKLVLGEKDLNYGNN